jgi:hypothetical protein
MAISLVIPNRDGRAYLGPCLEAIRGQTLPPDETIVVDDASRDDSLAFLAKAYPWVRALPAADDGRPRGFAGAVNAGIRAAAGSEVALLNNDTEAHPGWLAGLAAALAGAPDAAAAASRMYQKDGRTINAAGLLLRADGTVGALADGEPDGPRFETPREIFGPSGGAALWRRAVLEEIGLFDEDFFAYYEDADLAWRARAAGYTAVYAPASRVVHTEGRCPTLPRREKVALRLRNAAWFVWGNLPAGLLCRRGLRIGWALWGRYFCKYGLRPWKVEGQAFWRAAGMLLGAPRTLLAKRRRRQALRRVPAGALASWLGRDPFAPPPGG